MKDKLKKLKASAEQMISDAKMNGQTAEQAAALDAVTDQIEALKAQIDSLNRAERSVASLSNGTGRVTESQAGIFVGKDRVEDDPKAGFSSMADFALSVRNAGSPTSAVVSENFGKWMNMSTGERGETTATAMLHRGSAEGFAVPPEFRASLIDVMQGNEFDYDLFSLMSPEPTGKNTVELDADVTTPWGSSGVKAYYAAEAAQYTESSLVTNPQTVQTHNVHVFVTASDDLLSDYPQLSTRLTVKSGQALRYVTSAGIFSGSGVGQPLGYSKSASLITVAKETSQTAKTITANNILDMRKRALNRRRSFWLLNSDAESEIIKLVMPGGTTPIWTDISGGFKNMPDGKILGLPYYLTEHCQTLGTAGDIYLVDPAGYLHIERQGAVKFDSSIHLWFDYGKTAFRWTYRHGGQSVLSAAISPKNGSTTRSHIVTLATRA